MIKILDTNVASELMRQEPDPDVVGWIAVHPVRDLHTTSLTVAELWYGVMILPDGRRRRDLAARFKQAIELGFRGRILAFDKSAAVAYGYILADRRARGRPISVLDGQIAAIARDHDAFLVTRNVSDFEHCGIEIINPFDA